MAISGIDATGSGLTIKTTLDSGEHVKHVNVDAVAGTVNVNPVQLAAGASSGALVVGTFLLGNAIPAGGNIIGMVGIDGTLPAGDENIGNVDIASSVPTGTLETTGTLGALNDAVTVSGTGGVGINVSSGLTGTVIFEGSNDGTNWINIAVIDRSGGSILNTTTFPLNGNFLNAAWKQVRVRVSAYTSGSATARLLNREDKPITVLGTSSLTIGNVGIVAGSSLIGQVNMAPRTTGGCTMLHRKATGDTNLVSVKASAGQLYGFHVKNRAGAERFLKFYNKNSAPVLASDVPVMVIPLAAGETLNWNEPHGVPFAAGIAMSMTTGIADTDTGALTANDLVLNLRYT